MDKELTRTTFRDGKVIFGELELTNLISTLIRVYRFNNKNQTPVAVVIPHVAEVEGVEVEFPKTIEPVAEVEVVMPEPEVLERADQMRKLISEPEVKQEEVKDV